LRGRGKAGVFPGGNRFFKGGGLEKSRGKKGKKAMWNLTLCLRDTIFAGVGMVGLMMMSFALGALAGRGDIYRAASSWGLMNPESARVAQWSPAGTPPLTAAQASSATPVTEATPPPAAPPSAPHPAVPAHHSTVTAKAGHQAPVTGSIAAVPSPSAASKKKGKTATANHDPKSKEEELRRVRQEVVRKLKFQNSFDTAPKAAHKPKEKAPVKAAAAKTAAPVRVGQFRDSKAAKAKVAELQKKGVKASLKQTKDKKGTVYEVYKAGAVSPAAGDKKVAQSSAKKTGSGAAKKVRVE
jgi:hypothetical protein